MSIHIELKPDEERALLERARARGRDPVQYVQELIRDDIQVAPKKGTGDTAAGKGTAVLDDLIDHEFVAYCEREADDSVTLEEVRAATSKIKDSMARVVIEEERAERF